MKKVAGSLLSVLTLFVMGVSSCSSSSSGGGGEPSLDARIVDASGQELSEIVYTIGESVDPELYVKSDNYGERLQFLELDCGGTQEVAFACGAYNKLKKRFKITVQYVPNKPGSYTYTLFVNHDDKIDGCQELRFTVKVQGQEVAGGESIEFRWIQNLAENGYVGAPLSVKAETNISCSFAYEWYSTSANSDGDTKIEGAIGSSFTPSDAGRYFCRITATSQTNPNNKKKADSGTCTVSVRSADDPETPVIATQPSPQSVKAGGEFTLSVAAAVPANGGTLSYQWYRNKGVLPGATASTYTKKSAAKEDSGDYYVIVTSTKSGKTATVQSVAVTVTVTENDQPVGGTGNANGSFDFT